MKPLLTVFTPTYNRAYTLHKCYESLKRQSCRDFIWLIIDDGSTDETKELVDSWKTQQLVSIQYYYQENQGMHGAHNAAYERIETELNVCIDSDDYMPNDAVEKIIAFWNRYGSPEYAGIVGLDATPSRKIIGDPLPEQLKDAKLSDLHGKHHITGDKKLVYRTELTRKTPPYPIFHGEKYCPLSYKYLLIDQIAPLLLMNEILCCVEYMEDGSSLNMVHQYKKNPQGFSFFRKTAMQLAPTYRDKLREAAHYVSSNILLKNYKYILDSPNILATLLATPLGIILYFYIMRTNKSIVYRWRQNK